MVFAVAVVISKVLENSPRMPNADGISHAYYQKIETRITALFAALFVPAQRYSDFGANFLFIR